MGADFWIVVQWWGTLFLMGAVAFPLTKTLFSGLGSDLGKGQTPAKGQTPTPGWYDRGYLFSKAVGMAVVTYLVYLLGILHVAPFTATTVFWVLIGVFVGGLALLSFRPTSRNPLFEKKDGSRVTPGMTKKVMLILVEEIFFFAALLFWSWVKGHEPSIRGLEKFMDYGFMQSILNSSWFPAPDMWYVGFPINYYYFGHTVVAVLTKLSGVDLRFTFNLMLATIFAFTFTMSFSIGKQICQIGRIGRIGQILGGLLTAWLVTLAGNMQTLYAFTRGYTGEDVQPFWQLLWSVGEFVSKLPEGLERYWYANATRFIPFTIHEFPSYSFVVSDVHGHVLSIPFVLLAIALLINIFATRDTQHVTRKISDISPVTYYISLCFYGLLVAILLMTNALDGPIYLGLLIVILGVSMYQSVRVSKVKWQEFGKAVGVVIGVAALASLPFLWYFKSFVSGVAVNCPPVFLANTKIGPLIFEGVEKCQHSPLWMMALLWGFFWFCGGALLVSRFLSSRPPSRDPVKKEDGFRVKPGMTEKRIEFVLVVFFVFSLLLIIFPEFFYFKDIYPAHFRSNTMFKLGYDAFILFSIVSGYSIVKMFTLRVTSDWLRVMRKMFFIFLIPQLFLVSIYPIFSVRSYFDSLRTYKGIDGLAWLAEQYPDDYEAILWLNSQKQGSPTSPGLPAGKAGLRGAIMTGLPVIIEADGDSYTDYARFSAFTGLPTVVGWPVHEWLWRGTYDVVAPRREDVRVIYESEDLEETNRLLSKFGVSFIIVGTLEREKYPTLFEEKFEKLGTRVFSSGTTSVYAVR